MNINWNELVDFIMFAVLTYRTYDLNKRVEKLEKEVETW